jgi:hypothetical protein
MGSGKTTWAIAEMNAHPEQRYIYISPYLEQIERIVNDCPDLDFFEPSDECFTKSVDLKMLIRDGRSIAITHELFSRMELTSSLYEQISAYGYT